MSGCSGQERPRGAREADRGGGERPRGWWRAGARAAAAGLVCGSVWAVVLSGCSAAPLRIEPLEARVDVVGSRRLVVPVRVDGALGVGASVPVRLDDGRVMDASLYWVSVRTEPGETVVERWLEGRQRWEAVPASADVRPGGIGFWALDVDPPADAVGQGLWITGRRIEPNWLAEPAIAVAGAPAWGPVEVHPELERQAGWSWSWPPGPEEPLVWWRLRLLRDGLDGRGEGAEGGGSTGLAAADEGVPEQPSGWGVVRALTEQMVGRWQVALARLWRADSELFEAVRASLVATIAFRGEHMESVVAPAWRDDAGALLVELLGPGLREEQIRQAARRWLGSRPRATAWVISDAAAQDLRTGQVLALVGVANLWSEPVVAWAENETGGTLAEPVRLEPWSSGEVLVPVGAGGPDGVGRGTMVVVRVGGTKVGPVMALDPQPIRPPGVVFGPLVPDWTMRSWLGGRAAGGRTAGEPGATMGLVYRRPMGGWAVYVECARVGVADRGVAEGSGGVGDGLVGAGEDARDRPRSAEVLRLWFGPWAQARATVTVFADGRVESQPAGVVEAGEVVVRNEPERWVVHCPVPEEGIMPDGTVYLGLERVDERGRRSAWPRPMLPWQTEPGRAALETGRWGSLAAWGGSRAR